MTLVLDGGPLSLPSVEAVARRGEEVALAPRAAQALTAARAFVEPLGAPSAAPYRIPTAGGPPHGHVNHPP